MGLSEQVGQLLVAVASDAMPLARFVEEVPVGGFLLPNDTSGSARVVARAIAAAQERAVARSGEPLFIAADQEGGDMSFFRGEVTEVPSNMAIAATGDATAAREAALIVANDLGAIGINWALAPVVDVNTDGANPVIGVRSYGDDPAVVAAFAAEAIAGYQSRGILACAKHFPGHGDTHLDPNVAMPVVTHDRERLEGVELVPFRAAIAAGVASIMSAHLLAPALDPDRPATLSAPILTGLLRRELGFDGLIVTGAMPMGAISKEWDEGEAAVAAVNAGADVVLGGRGLARHKRVHRALLAAVDDGRVPRARFVEALARVRDAKARITTDEVGGRVGTGGDRSRALGLARRTITLVRDDPQILPLTRDLGDRLVVLSPAGTDATRMELSHARPSALGTEIADRVRGAIDIPIAYPLSRSERAAVARAARRAEVIVVGTLNAAIDRSQLALLRWLSEETKASIVVVALRGPYDVLRMPWVRTVLCAYSSAAPSLRAVAEVLTGEQLARGALPVSLPVARHVAVPQARRTSA